MNTWKLATVVGVIGLSVASHATFYTSEASFLAAIASPFYLEDFSNFTFGSPLDGSQLSWAAPGGNGYGWTASTPLGLYSNTSALSTNTSDETLTLTFTGSPVTAFGGLVNNTDVDGNAQGGTVTIAMSNGDSLVVNDGTFVGWVGNSAVTSVALSAGNHNLSWIQLDHTYTGANSALVPEPASMAALGLGVAALIRRRRSKK